MMVCKENHPQTDLISALGIVLAWRVWPDERLHVVLPSFANVLSISQKNSEIGAFAEFDHDLNPEELRG
jgi:hypothetical protein